jgi:hypothetical protein
MKLTNPKAKKVYPKNETADPKYYYSGGHKTGKAIITYEKLKLKNKNGKRMAP